MVTSVLDPQKTTRNRILIREIGSRVAAINIIRVPEVVAIRTSKISFPRLAKRFER